MAKRKHLKIIKKKGVEAWNEWRENNREEKPDLSEAYLAYANLQEADLEGANLQEANLWKANLQEAKNLTLEQLSEVWTLYDAQGLNPNLMGQIRKKYPHLLKNPKKIFLGSLKP